MIIIVQIPILLSISPRELIIIIDLLICADVCDHELPELLLIRNLPIATDILQLSPLGVIIMSPS